MAGLIQPNGYTPGMRNLSRRFCFLLLPALLAGCGAKGPLFLPEPPAEEAVLPVSEPESDAGDEAVATPVPLAVAAVNLRTHG